ncbi:MAG: DNA-binding response regulator [Bacteroidetes bacterium 4572_112]|nr:MAG: DNA-binding response regulator [Bacteroidetes bacterium 4572_112]
MKVIIIEDEPYAVEKLRLMLSKINNDIEIIASGGSVKDAVDIINNNTDIDLAFFDIQLSDGISFSIFDKVDVQFPVIFTTAYDNHAIRAFKHNSIDYLLKPIRISDLQSAIDKYNTLWKPTNSKEIKEQLIDFKSDNYKERFTVKVGEHIRIIKLENISCFYSFEKGTFIQTNDDRNYIIDYSLDDLLLKLDPKKFYRVNRKYIINIEAIKDIISYTNSRLKIILKTTIAEDIIVSRERVKEFKDWIA